MTESILTAKMLEDWIQKMPRRDAFEQIILHPNNYRALRKDLSKDGVVFPFHFGTKIIPTYSGMQICVDPSLEEGSAYIVQKDRIGNFTKTIMSLNSTSEMSINEHMSEQTDMIELAEMLVEIDRKIAEYGGRFDSELSNERHFEGQTYTDAIIPMGSDAFSKGEVLKPAGLVMDRAGRIEVLMEVTAGDTTYKYASLNLDQLEDSFPSLSDALRDMDFDDGGGDGVMMSGPNVIRLAEQRVRDKPALITLCQDYLKNGREVVDDLKAAQRAKDAASFYEDDAQDYGSF